MTGYGSWNCKEFVTIEWLHTHTHTHTHSHIGVRVQHMNLGERGHNSVCGIKFSKMTSWK